MALAIKNTPVLEGKTSKRFNEMISKSTSVSQKRIEEIRALTKAVLAKKKN